MDMSPEGGTHLVKRGQNPPQGYHLHNNEMKISTFNSRLLHIMLHSAKIIAFELDCNSAHAMDKKGTLYLTCSKIYIDILRTTRRCTNDTIEYLSLKKSWSVHPPSSENPFGFANTSRSGPSHGILVFWFIPVVIFLFSLGQSNIP